MLVLTRKPGERITIGPDITITVLEVRRSGSTVRLGITAPREIAIDRPDAKQHDNRLSPTVPPTE